VRVDDPDAGSASARPTAPPPRTRRQEFIEPRPSIPTKSWQVVRVLRRRAFTTPARGDAITPALVDHLAARRHRTTEPRRASHALGPAASWHAARSDDRGHAVHAAAPHVWRPRPSTASERAAGRHRCPGRGTSPQRSPTWSASPSLGEEGCRPRSSGNWPTGLAGPRPATFAAPPVRFIKTIGDAAMFRLHRNRRRCLDAVLKAGRYHRQRQRLSLTCGAGNRPPVLR